MEIVGEVVFESPECFRCQPRTVAVIERRAECVRRGEHSPVGETVRHHELDMVQCLFCDILVVAVAP